MIVSPIKGYLYFKMLKSYNRIIFINAVDYVYFLQIDSLPDVKKKLQNVSYSSRYALGLFFSPKKPLNYSWCAKYISDNPCLRYIAIDQNKRGVSKFFTYNNGKYISLFVLYVVNVEMNCH